MEHKLDTTSDAASRRLITLARHLEVSKFGSSKNDGLYPSITSGFDGNSDSVFAHVVRAPEDPILGVYISLFLFFSLSSRKITAIIEI